MLNNEVWTMWEVLLKNKFYQSYRAVIIMTPLKLELIERFNGTGREEIYVYRKCWWATFTEIHIEVLKLQKNNI
jgi:hypothetical protein